MEKALCIGHQHNKELEEIGWCLGVAEVNTYMSRLLQNQQLLPLSLKQATPNAIVKITPNNLKKDPDGVEGLTGEIEGALSDKLKVIRVDANSGGIERECRKLDRTQYAQARDSGSIHYATVFSPVYHIGNTPILYIFEIFCFVGLHIKCGDLT